MSISTFPRILSLTRAEKCVKDWYASQGVHLDIVHKEGCGLVPNNGDLYVEVKGSTKEKFDEFRPYFTLAELNQAIEKEKNYKIQFATPLKSFELKCLGLK
jgi:hypothetical protein